MSGPSEQQQRLAAAAERAGRATYTDPQSGLQVFTAAALAARGVCCGNGCRHCPWPPEEPPACAPGTASAPDGR